MPNHKISAPKAHRNAVERERLLAHMFGDAPSRVVVFQGPAGHGKTSLMLQAKAACNARGMLTGWISLDETDNDVRRFLGHAQEMVSGLLQPTHDTHHPQPSAAATDVSSRTDWFVGQLLQLGRPVAVFIDDLHAVSSRLTLGFLRELLAHAPHSIRWFLASRLVPDIGLPRLVVGDEALIIRAEELRFSRPEVQRFFECAKDVQVNEAEVLAIHNVTEGWPAAVQLYRLALGSPSVRDSLGQGHAHQVRELADYLADNVLARQEPRIQDFLLKTCVLGRMSAPLCDAVVGRSDSQEILSTLEGTGLFVRRVGSDQRWFTYHALFSNFLQDHLRTADPKLVVNVHRRAADWYREHGNLEESLHHYASAGDYGKAADMFDLWTERLVPDGHFMTIDRWSDTLPIEELEQRPALIIKIVWALAFLSRHRKLASLLKLLRAIPPDLSSSADPRVALSMVAILQDDLAGASRFAAGIDTFPEAASRFRTFELSAVSNLRGYTAMTTGDFDSALMLLARGRVLSDMSAASFTWAYSTGKTALTLLAQGQLQEALVHFRTALSDPRMYLDESIATACLACGSIMALYESDDLDGALTQFQQFHETLSTAAIHDYLVVAYRAVARIHDLRGEPAAALAILDEAENLAYAGQWPRAVRLIGWERVRRELMTGRVDRAQIIAGRMDREDDSETIDWVRFSEDAEGAFIGRVRLGIRAGRCAETLRLIQPRLRHAIAQKRVHRQIKLHLLAALAYKKQSKGSLAHRSLKQALDLAAPGGYVRALLDEGEDIYQLLLEHLRLQMSNTRSRPDSETHHFLLRLIGTTNVEMPTPASAIADRGTRSERMPKEAFTEREKQILAMLGNYLSNGQIAEQTFISRDTVKYHLKNIYGKLGVRSRLEAIRLYRDTAGL